jgi:hypothetical protein
MYVFCQGKTHVAKCACESAHFSVKIFSSHNCLSAVVPGFVGSDIHLLPLARVGPSQKIELMFSASPETVREEPKESFDFRRSLGQGGTWQSARFTISRFSWGEMES